LLHTDPGVSLPSKNKNLGEGKERDKLGVCD